MGKIKSFFILTILIFAAITLAAFLFFSFYGKSMVENALSKALGANVRFEGFSINLRDYTVDFKGVSVPGKIDFGDKAMFNAEKFTVTLDKEKFNRNREVVFDQIVIEKGTLHIERDRKGVFNVSYGNMVEPRPEAGVAYAAEPQPLGLYNFAKIMRKLTIKDSVVEFKDYYLYGEPYMITFNNFNLDVISGQETKPYEGYIPLKGTLSFTVPSSQYSRSGNVFLSANVNAYKYLVDAQASIKTNYIDAMQFKPYFENYTPFIFMEGLFSSNTDFSMQNSVINSLTTMVFHRLRLMVNPNKQNAQFLHTSANRLLPYLTSQSGDVVFDFVIKGPIDHPEASLGPRVQEAVSAVVMEEIGRVLQGLQKIQ